MTTAVRGRVWRRIFTTRTSTTRTSTTRTTETRWLWAIWGHAGNSYIAETETWQTAYTQCVAAVIAARTPTEPPF